MVKNNWWVQSTLVPGLKKGTNLASYSRTNGYIGPSRAAIGQVLNTHSTATRKAKIRIKTNRTRHATVHLGRAHSGKRKR